MATQFKRHVYLNMKTLEQVQEIINGRFASGKTLESEIIPTVEALDRVTAQPLFARYSCPSYHSAAMDGIAVMAEDTYGASPDLPKTLIMGQQAYPVNTGHVLPMSTNAVIMIEHIHDLGDGGVQIEAAAYPWQHVRKVGEDIVATEMVLPQGCRLGPYELGALVAAGLTQVPVRVRPKVIIIPTGSELVSAEHIGSTGPQPGQLVEYNSVILAALVRRAGAQPVIYPVVPDDYPSIVETLKKAVADKGDLVIINAGSSAGSEDYTATAIAELGEVLVHGVTIMPGKPTIIGTISGKPVVGNPGYPVSAVISFEQFIAPLLACWQGLPAPDRPTVEVEPTQALPSKLGLEEFLRVRLGRVGDRYLAVPLPRGAGSITTLTKADGIIRIPVNSEGVTASEKIKAELLRSPGEIDGAIIAIGSHDNTLDVLGDHLRRRDPRLTLSSGNVGSLGGLLTLKRGNCHLAGSHLLDTETGEYNYSYIQKHLVGFPVRLVNLVTRDQGFLVRPGNPKNITTFADLNRPEVTFINRQAGSGTRILLDYNLKILGLSPEAVKGYEAEEYTHMAVAVAVLSGRADVGLAVYSSAKALGLDFVPVTTERYDLVIPELYYGDSRLQTLMEVIRSDEFKTAVLSLGGYGVDQTGELLWTWDGGLLAGRS